MFCGTVKTVGAFRASLASRPRGQREKREDVCRSTAATTMMFFTTASTVTKDEFQFQIFPTDFRVKLATLMMMTPAADRQRLGISRLEPVTVRTAFCAGLLENREDYCIMPSPTGATRAPR